MPSKNTIKIYAPNHYYHVYNRGANKEVIFREDTDYQYFLSLFKRHLGKRPVFNRSGREYRHLSLNVELVAYCLMANHFHLLLYNIQENGMELLMRSVITAYSMFYNKKYNHSGHVFQGAYKASLIDSDAYLQHICRYIHRNPQDYKSYSYSSYTASIRSHNVEWLGNRLFTDIFEGTPKDYEEFVADYKAYKETLEETLPYLANK